MGANYSGLLVAGAGFFLTRFTVTLAIYEDPFRFYLAGIVPLTLGLGLAAFGVALTVADVDPHLVRTTAAWCVVGLGAMLVLVVLTLLGSTPGGLPDLATARSQAYLSNFLIGGSVGGTLTGLYAASNRQNRDGARRQADRLTVLNRLLRHEVLNALTVIRGAVGRADGSATRAVIEEKATDIERTIEEVRYLTRSGSTETPAPSGLDLRSCLLGSVEAVEERHPDVRVAVEHGPADLTVLATPRLGHVFTHLIENAVVHAGDDAPRVTVTATSGTVRVRVADRGGGLSDAQRGLVERGDVEPFDDPGAGFGLNLVRLYVDDVGGTISVDHDGGAAVTVELPREVDDPTRLPLRGDETTLRPALPHLLVTLVASLLAGVVYGLTSETLGGSVAGIGVFYGAVSPVVGWITHEFHSVVFGFVFAGLLTLGPGWLRRRPLGHVAVGLAWACVLWVVAAGVIAPVWLLLLGIPATVPNLTVPILVSHLAWGASLGGLTAVGYRHMVPPLARRLDARPGGSR